jgi:hypothetical protein
LEAKRLAGAEKFFLAKEFVEGARTHALSKRLVSERYTGLDRLRKFGEEAHDF